MPDEALQDVAQKALLELIWQCLTPIAPRVVVNQSAVGYYVYVDPAVGARAVEALQQLEYNLQVRGEPPTDKCGSYIIVILPP